MSFNAIRENKILAKISEYTVSGYPVLCVHFHLYLATALLESAERRKYITINLHESMGPGQDRTRYPWISNQTCYQLRIHVHKTFNIELQPDPFFYVGVFLLTL